MVPDKEIRATDLTVEQQRLLATAREARAQRAAHTLYGSRDTVLRQTMIALVAGCELAEHESPPEATLQVLSGAVRLSGVDRHWDLSAGDLLPIPPERHSVSAREDSVLLLTAIRATGGGDAGPKLD